MPIKNHSQIGILRAFLRWGEKAFTGYLGPDRSLWSNYDASELVRHTIHQNPILIDQGMADGFLESQLKPELFEAACHATLRLC